MDMSCFNADICHPFPTVAAAPAAVAVAIKLYLRFELGDSLLREMAMTAMQNLPTVTTILVSEIATIICA